jgi:glycosyltransferase involved in cell wall biosynthesis
MPPAPRTTVLLVTDWFPPASIGGVEVAAWALALAVAGSGGSKKTRVAVLTPALPGGPGPGIRAVAVPGSPAAVVRVYYAPRGAGAVAAAGLSRAGGPAWAPPSPAGLLPLLRSVAAQERSRVGLHTPAGSAAPPIVLHAHSSASPFALACLAAGRALGWGCVLTEHSIAGTGDGKGGGGGFGRAAWAAAAAALAPPALTAVSAAAAADAAARLGRPAGSVAVTANAIDGGALAPAAVTRWRAEGKNTRTPSTTTTTVRVLSVTRLTARKGAAELGAAIRAAAAGDPGLAFTVVGGGPGRAALEAALGWSGDKGGGGTDEGGTHASAASLFPPAPRARVTLLGPAPPVAIPGLLACHDAFLSASPTEAFGLAALEAGAAGLALVVRGVGGAAQALAPLLKEGGGGGGGRVALVPPAAGAAGLAAGVAAAAAAVRRARALPRPPTAPQPPPPLAAVLVAHCWHRAADDAVAVYRRAAADATAAGASPPALPGRPALRAARAALHAALCAWATLLDVLDPPGRTGTVTVCCAS